MSGTRSAPGPMQKIENAPQTPQCLALAKFNPQLGLLLGLGR